jgi:threonine dehydratase
LTIKAAQEFGWYCRNTGYNPFTAEGKKTAAFEIWEHAAEAIGNARITVFVSVGDGNIISGIHKGFKDLLELGWIGSDAAHHWRAGRRVCRDSQRVSQRGPRKLSARFGDYPGRQHLRGPAARWRARGACGA